MKIRIYIYIHIYIYIIIIPSLLLFEDRYIMIYIIVHIDRSILLLSIHNILHKCRKKQPSVWKVVSWVSKRSKELDYVARFPRLFPGSWVARQLFLCRWWLADMTRTQLLLVQKADFTRLMSLSSLLKSTHWSVLDAFDPVCRLSMPLKL